MMPLNKENISLSFGENANDYMKKAKRIASLLSSPKYPWHKMIKESRLDLTRQALSQIYLTEGDFMRALEETSHDLYEIYGKDYKRVYSYEEYSKAYEEVRSNGIFEEYST